MSTLSMFLNLHSNILLLYHSASEHLLVDFRLYKINYYYYIMLRVDLSFFPTTLAAALPSNIKSDSLAVFPQIS